MIKILAANSSVYSWVVIAGLFFGCGLPHLFINEEKVMKYKGIERWIHFQLAASLRLVLWGVIVCTLMIGFYNSFPIFKKPAFLIGGICVVIIWAILFVTFNSKFKR